LAIEEKNVTTSKLAIEEQNGTTLELAIKEQNVTTSKLAIEEKNVVKIEEPRIDETSSQCNLKLDMVFVSNLSDEILPKKIGNFD
jgi:hypothetical protein